MKKLVYSASGTGRGFNYSLEVYLDTNREIDNIDFNNIREHCDKIVSSVHKRTIQLSPESAEQAKTEKEGILLLFGDRSIFVEEIPNGYCSDYCCEHLPWFIVTTNKGRIKIGWRKRVINIDWSDSIVLTSKAEELFPNENVTKGDYYIHAWGYEKAKEYIDILLS